MDTSSLLHSNTLCRCSGILNVYVISVNVLRRPNRGWETIQTSYVLSSVFVSHSNHSTQLIQVLALDRKKDMAELSQ